ncbi:TRAP transporter small permease [Roseovarius sp. SYSU LYC5161]|uniref:TRAP transporter small permease n=1 Tax=Roseovarius halophilus (ex Wu et al. 2025) TaxID=3376060 RepID=UPI00399A9305
MGRIYERILSGLAILGGLLLVFLVVVIGGEAILRLFNIGLIRGSVQFSEYALFSLAMLAAPWLLYHDGHLRVTVVLDNLAPRAKARVMLLTDFIGLAATTIALRFAFEVFGQSYQRGQLIFKDVVVSEWLLQWQVPLALVLLVIEFLRRIYLMLGTPVGRAALTGVQDNA